MKKIYFFLIILSGFEKVQAQTSVYRPFPDSAIVWRENFGSGYFSGCSSFSICVTEKDYQYFLGPDIDIDGVIYKKILKNGFTHIYTTGGPPCPGCGNTIYYYSNEYSGSIRQDIPQRKIYFQSTDETGEVLLYDFNLNIGDPLPESIINPYIDNYVSAIDSVLIGINYHKRYWISKPGGPLNYTSLMEGIGGDMGLLTQLTPPFEEITSLMCVTIDGIPVYPDTATLCETVTEVQSVAEKPIFWLAPNPFSTSSTLRINLVLEKVELRIYNSLGKKIKEIKNISEQDITIQRDGLEEGIYFLQLSQFNDILIAAKFIITNQY